MLIVNEASPKQRKSNQKDFISSALPWLMKEKSRFTGKNPDTAFLFYVDTTTPKRSYAN
jgi:hypothetical protein